MELFNAYEYSASFYFTVFDLTPYKQIVRWYRPEWAIYNLIEDGTQYWDINVSG